MFEPQTFTLIHAGISLLTLATGVLLLVRLAAARSSDRLSAVYLALAVMTSVTGFGFPLVHLLPSHAMGLFSLIALALAFVARYRCRLAGRWRTVYAVGIVASVYFDTLLAIVQAFQKIALLHAIAPTIDALPYEATQTAASVVLTVLGVATVRGLKRIG